MAERERPAGVILAGGQGSRLGRDAPGGKAFAALGDRPLVAHVRDRLAPQVSELWLSLAPGSSAPSLTGTEPLVDRAPRHRGPLAGLRAALERLEERRGRWLVMSPCDVPFLPRDLAERLLGAATRGLLATVAADEERLHPACSAWRVDALADVVAALEAPEGPGLMGLLDRLPHGVVRWPPATPPPFHNVNDDADLARARAWLEGG